MNRALLLGVCALSVGICAHAADKPNFIILFADDLGYGDLGCFGHPTIRTPNLDRMAAEGIKLTSFYAAPSCSPSRAAIMTGRYCVRTGIDHVLGPHEEIGMRPSEITLAEALKPLGYRTAAVGKWHLGHARTEYLPLAQGFDQYFGLLYSNDMQPPWVRTDKPLKLWRDNHELDEYPVDQDTLTTRYTDEAVTFIRDARDGPFFVYLAYTMVHVPIHSAPEFQGQSPRGRYGDAVEDVDRSVGRIIQTLREEGLEQNTLVVFTSDNGPWMHMPDRMLQDGKIVPSDAGSAGPLRGWKGSTYEGGIRVPFIAWWPGRIPTMQVSSGAASTMDLYTTAISLAGGRVPTDRVIDGLDIWPLLEGAGASPRNEFFYFRGEFPEAVREGPWKLRISNHLRTDWPADAPAEPELYNLDVDPSETFNLAAERPKRVAHLEARLDQFTKEFAALSALANR